MDTLNDLSSVKGSTCCKTADRHYRSLAKSFDYLYKERKETEFAALLKYLDVQPDHIVVDIGSGTGYLAEKVFQKFQLKTPIWCVEPCAEMQEVAKKRKGVLPIQKTADEFFKDFVDSDQRFDRVICTGTAHHFGDPVKIYRSIESCLSPGGVLVVELMSDATNTPYFTKAENANDALLGEFKENTCAWLRLANFDVEVLEERMDYSVTKSKWYDMLRGRFYSSLSELNDMEIEEGIDELERGRLKDLKLQDDIRFSCTLLIFIAKKPGH
ncbi:hypothetical protein OS493_025406 [Desmophyllum pertusum]|uniref:Methyltransferase domain-containing protein n=1 Tax=Desmophyllum pertusum TaxID=174260 RepID=A0A9W9YPG1_9CNID|nr:hypothetical protein OS493_025406 [Desmophyllum pertusum]